MCNFLRNEKASVFVFLHYCIHTPHSCLWAPPPVWLWKWNLTVGAVHVYLPQTAIELSVQLHTHGDVCAEVCICFCDRSQIFSCSSFCSIPQVSLLFPLICVFMMWSLTVKISTTFHWSLKFAIALPRMNFMSLFEPLVSLRWLHM